MTTHPTITPCSTKAKLLNTAVDLAWKSSYESVGVNEICEKAGVTKGSFYYYFESKADLFYEAAEYYWEQKKVELDKIFSPQNNAIDQLHKMIDFIIQKQVDNGQPDDPVAGCPFFSSAAQSGSDEVLVRRAAFEMAEKSFVYCAQLVRNLVAEGHIPATVDPAVMGRFISHYIQGVLMYGRVKRDLGLVTQDLMGGLYRLLGLTPQFPADKPKV